MRLKLINKNPLPSVRGDILGNPFHGGGDFLYKQVIILLEWEPVSFSIIPRPHPFGLAFYTHIPLFSIHGTIIPSVNGVHQTWWSW